MRILHILNGEEKYFPLNERNNHRKLCSPQWNSTETNGKGDYYGLALLKEEPAFILKETGHHPTQ